MTKDELSKTLEMMGEPRYRAVQVFKWLHRGIESFDEMTDIPKTLRDKLSDEFTIKNVKIKKRLESSIDDTVKYLYELDDGEKIECVVMKYLHGYSICISTQAGCRMGCSFCASGLFGLKRNLTASEMLSEITAAQKDLNIRISNVVLMGMGEPLDNFENTVRFLKLVSCDDGLNIGLRHISLSTCGIVPKILELMEYEFPITLSVSLHAPDNTIRDRIMKINHVYPVEQLISACRKYFKKTNRRISFEYAIIKDVNNSEECAFKLFELLKGLPCHINLIPANPVKENNYSAPSRRDIKNFQSQLEALNMNVTVRRTLGADINASCGQLRNTEQG
jgi:23S rRNA m2A2503 methyltransferase